MEGRVVDIKAFNAAFREWFKSAEWVPIENNGENLVGARGRRFYKPVFIPDSISLDVHTLCGMKSKDICEKIKFINAKHKGYIYQDDATSEAFARVWSYLWKYDPEKSAPTTWIYLHSSQAIQQFLKKQFTRESQEYKNVTSQIERMNRTHELKSKTNSASEDQMAHFERHHSGSQ